MQPHHAESINNAVAYFKNEPEVEALILAGSLAHGFAEPASDIDVLIIISDELYAARLDSGHFQFFNQQLCTYPEGYVDGKYLGLSFLQQVAERGSEPARYAFVDAQVLFSRVEQLPELLRSISRYPVEGKADRLGRFYAQFEAWHWYAHEALKKNNRYLLGTAISRLVLFGGRLILTHNERLYPYHKWFLKALAQAPDKPADLLTSIESLYDEPDHAHITHFYEQVMGFRNWSTSATPWPNQFMLDSELNWLHGATPIEDL